MTHDKCGENCRWPRFHKDLEDLKTEETYMGVKLEANYPGRLRNTRAVFEAQQEGQGQEQVLQSVTQKMEDLVRRLKQDLRWEMFTSEVSDAIELTRDICDLSTLAEKVKEHGHVVVGLLKAESWCDKMYQLTNSIDQIPKDALKEAFKSFLSSFERYIESKVAKGKNIDSKETIKDFLSEDGGLYKGNEIILHCFCVVAVKFSVESSVESLISRYEVHFNKRRQLKTENAAQEIYISENGPLLVRNFFSYFDLQLMNLYCQVHADKLLKRALDKFFIAESNSANWHFYHSDLTRFYESDHSKTVKRLQAQRSRLSFVEK